mgnify:FL=1
MFLVTLSTGDSLRRRGNLPEALPVLLEEVSEDPSDPRLLYSLAWTANRMEMPEDALAPAEAAWTLEPWNQWYLAEYLRALRSMEMYGDMMEISGMVRGGGVCRYYLAACERELGMDPSPSKLVLQELAVSDDDSTASDALIWLVLLLDGEVTGDSLLKMAERAVELSPDEDFYRCVLAERLAEMDEVEAARVHLHILRLRGATGYSYWGAVAAAAEAEDDGERRVWALRRAMEARVCPQSVRDLGWALYFLGRDSLRGGELEMSRTWLEESAGLGDTSEIFVQRADSLLDLINEFENAAAGGH